MPEGQKEAMTAQTFDEDEYKANLVDKEGYSDETAAMMATKKKDQLATQAEKGPVKKMIEIDLNDILEKAKTKKKVVVRRGGKTFYREQEVGSDAKKVEPKKLSALESQQVGTTMGNPNGFLTPKKFVKECITAAGGDPNELKYYPNKLNMAYMPGKYVELFNTGSHIITTKKLKLSKNSV